VAVQSIWTVVAINLVGCFALGVLTSAAGDWSPAVRDGLGIGFLGGFTTFSTFAVQAVVETDAGRPGIAALYLALSVLGGLAAATLGYALGRAM
jgi:CrcB protein